MEILKGAPDSLKAIAFFTEEEKSALRKMLVDFPKDQVWWFVQQAQFICTRVLLYRETYGKLEYKRPSITDHKNELKDAIKKMNGAIEVLNKIQKGKLNPHWHYTLEQLGPLYPTGKPHRLSDDPIRCENVKASRIASEITQKMGELISIFQKAYNGLPNKKGSPGTIDTELAVQIAEAYNRYIAAPTDSINEPFCHILKILFKAVEIDLAAPEKLAGKAIKKIPTK